MRHQLSGRQLSRNAPHRQAMLRNMAASLLRHETIRTTLPKAKELRRVVEPLITLSKADSEANRRRAFSLLRDAEMVVKLFETLGPRFNARPGGYTRILRMDPRAGDAAPMALMQLLDQPPADEADSAEGEEGGSKKKAAGKKVVLRRLRSTKAVKTEAEQAEKKARAESRAAAKAKKAEAQATRKAAAKKSAAPKKKASAKKKAGVKKKAARK